jgi:hypothetical protein
VCFHPDHQRLAKRFQGGFEAGQPGAVVRIQQAANLLLSGFGRWYGSIQHACARP